jgi:hypothetical protein
VPFNPRKPRPAPDPGGLGPRATRIEACLSAPDGATFQALLREVEDPWEWSQFAYDLSVALITRT